MKYLYVRKIYLLLFLVSFLAGNTLWAAPSGGDDPFLIFPSPFLKLLPTKVFPKIPLKSPEGEVYQKNQTTDVFELVKNSKLNLKTNQIISFDPVRFSIQAKSDSILLGKEIELTIKAEFLDVHPQLMFTDEGSNEFTLKMLFPKEFVVTGGSYYDYIKGKVSKENPTQTFTVKGFFETIIPNAEFRLLRSHNEATSNDYFVVKSVVNFKQVKNKEIFLLENPNEIAQNNNRIAETQSIQNCYPEFRFAVSTNTIGGCGLVNGDVLNFESVSCPNNATTTWYKRADNELASSVSILWSGATFTDVFSYTKPIYFAKCSDNNGGTCTSSSNEINFGGGVYISPNNSGQATSETRYYCPSATTQQILTASCVPGRPLWSNGSTALTITVQSTTPSSYTYRCVRNGCTPTEYITNYSFNIVEDCSGGVSCTPFTVTASSNSSNFNVTTNADLVLNANTAEPNVTYTWIGPNGFSNANQNPIRSNTNITMSGKYTVTARNASGCVGTATTFVNLNQGACVNPSPIGIFSKVINKANCNPLQAGDIVVLTATGCDFNVVWGGSGSGQTGSTLQFTMPSASVTYTAKCVDRTCESPQASINLALNASGAVGNPKVLPCNGTVTLEVGCESGVPTWRDGTASNTLVVSAVGTYYFDCKTQTCLVRTGAIVVTQQGTINPPTITGVNNISSICGSTPATLNANGCVGVVTWTTPAGYTGITTGVSIQTATEGNYSAICTSSCGVSLPSSVFTLTVDPVFTITPTNNSSNGQIPVGGTISFSVSTTSSNSLNYRWIGPDGFQNNTTSLTFVLPNVTTNANGTYTVTATSASGCTATATTTVLILNASCPVKPPTLTVSANKTVIPFGGAVTLTAQSCAGTILWTSNTFEDVNMIPTSTKSTFTSSPINGVSIVNVSPVANILSDHAPTIVYTAQCLVNGCLSDSTAISQAVIQLTTFPCMPPDNFEVIGGSNRTESIVNFGANQKGKEIKIEVCSTESFTLVATGCDRVLTWGSFYSSGNSYTVGSSSRTVEASTMQADEVTYSVSCPADFCPSPNANIYIKVIRKSVSLTADNDSKNGEIATGGTVNLSTTSTSTGLTYAWAGPNNFTSTIANPIISSATVAINGTYTVTATNTAGCSASATTGVLIQDVSTTCEGFKIKAINPANSTETSNLTRNPTNTSEFLPLTLSIEPTAGGSTTGFTYSWTGPEGFTFTTPTAATQSINKPGEYKVVITKTVGTPCSLTIKIGSGPCLIKPVNYTTCKPVTIVNPNATNLAQALTAGSKFYAADYLVEVYEATGTAQGWTGKGRVEVVLIGGVKANVAVEFNNIQINDCYELVNGTVKTAYDPTWGNIVDVDGVIEDIKTLVSSLTASLQETKDVLENGDPTNDIYYETILKLLSDLDKYKRSVEQSTELSITQKTFILNELSKVESSINAFTSCGSPSSLKGRVKNVQDCSSSELEFKNAIDNALKVISNANKKIPNQFNEPLLVENCTIVDLQGKLLNSAIFSTPEGNKFILPANAYIKANTYFTDGSHFNCNNQFKPLYFFEIGGKAFAAKFENLQFKGYYTYISGSNYLDEKFTLTPTTDAYNEVCYSETNFERILTIKSINNNICTIKSIKAEENYGLEGKGKTLFDRYKSQVTNDPIAKAKLVELAKLYYTLSDELTTDYYLNKDFTNDVSSTISYFPIIQKPTNIVNSANLEATFNSLKSYFDAYKRLKEIGNNPIFTDTQKTEVINLVNQNFVGGQDLKFFFASSFKQFTSTQRANLIKILSISTMAGQWNIGSNMAEEDIVIVLLKTVPDEFAHRKDLLDFFYSNNINNINLIKKLVDGIDGDNFSRFTEILTSFIIKCYPVPEKFDIKLAAANKRFIHFNDNYLGTSNSENINKNGSISLYVKKFLTGSTETYNVFCPPYEYISITFENDLQIGQSIFEKRTADLKNSKSYKLPALYVYFLFNNDTKEKWKTSGRIALMAALTAVGASEILLAVESGSTLGAIAGTVDMAVGIGDIVIVEAFKNEINTKYPKFAANWTTISLCYGLGRLGYVGLKTVVNSARAEARLMKNDASLSPEAHTFAQNADNRLNGPEFSEFADDLNDALRLTRLKFTQCNCGDQLEDWLVDRIKNSFSTAEIQALDGDLVNNIVLRNALNSESELLEIWKNIKYLNNERKNINFLKALKPTKIVTQKHVIGELNTEAKTYGWKIQVKGYHKEVQEVDIIPPLFGNAGIPNPANSNSPIIVSLGTQANPATKGQYRISNVMNYVNDNLPYTAKIDVEIPIGSGNFFSKSGTDGINVGSGRSSMFPKNWDLDKIAEETAYARSKINSSSTINSDNTYSYLNSDGTFEIKMYINGNLNDYNAPIGSTFPKVR